MENKKVVSYPKNKIQAINDWLELALQDADKGVNISAKDIIANPLLAIEIANKAANGDKPYGLSYMKIDVWAEIKSIGCDVDGRKPHLCLGWASQGYSVLLKISLNDQPHSVIAYEEEW